MSHIMRKPVFGSLQPGKTHSRLLSYRDQLEAWNFRFSKLRYYTILRIGTLTGGPLCRESHPLCRLKNPTVVYMITCRLSSCKTDVYNVYLLIILQRGCSSMYRKEKRKKAANNKGADQTVPMCRLICAYCCSHMAETGFLMMWLISSLLIAGTGKSLQDLWYLGKSICVECHQSCNLISILSNPHRTTGIQTQTLQDKA